MTSLTLAVVKAVDQLKTYDCRKYLVQDSMIYIYISIGEYYV